MKDWLSLCWVAREVHNAGDSRWLIFRSRMLTDAPAWLRDTYVAHGESFAGWLRDKPAAKAAIRAAMDRVIAGRPLPPAGP